MVQLPLPSAVEIKPAGQAVHTALPVIAAYLLAAQITQAVPADEPW